MKKTVVITGANRGIGLSLVQLYQAAGWQVIAVCRASSTELEASGAQIIERIDVADPTSIQQLSQQLAQDLSHTGIDLLINNAGILRDEVLGEIDYASIQLQLDINALAPLRITEALQSKLTPGAKVVMITSRMGSLADNTSGGRYGYRMSKAALNMAAVSLAHDLQNQQIAVGVIHPGLVGTRMIGGHGDLTPDQAAQQISQRIDELTLENSGSFWHSNGEALPW
ncbi:SDR family oxidoreductase [Arenicella xantha]|uniref:NAD(P)-dependent dehydrogenase (Short-subunit alcohol dehydrogenase family) n=1 Tax=Arenicella xantha TaxID=644221 RepID=A0A395JL90_9GAMM|nr:SDR family oxidoreductase [Arenicella xantha]RBP51195.1 NAD(P)-dependent dehydrogenase (short-subunit alcohol dehydrogenase family) [Arenicella xantha]